MLHNNGTTIMVLFNAFYFCYFIFSPLLIGHKNLYLKKKQETGTEKWTRSPHK